MPDHKLYLPEHFDGSTASQVVAEMLSHRGKPLTLHGARVKSAGALGLQVLISATKQWAHDDQPFTVVDGSDALIRGVEVLGMDSSDLGIAAPQVPA
ncbi:MAG: STAS domain-containing protein [Pseudomonadota bacterium]